MSFMNAKVGDVLFEGQAKITVRVDHYDRSDDEYMLSVLVNGNHADTSGWLCNEEEVNEFLGRYDPQRNLKLKKEALEKLKNEIKELEEEIAQVQ